MNSFIKNIVYDDNQVKYKMILESRFSKEIQIVMKEGQFIKEHKTPYPVILHILNGTIELGVHNELIEMKSGDIIDLEGNISHDLKAKENSVIRLTLSKLDKVERLNNVLKS
jgi:quercetin dioxygenase-like cupin family protein